MWLWLSVTETVLEKVSEPRPTKPTTLPVPPKATKEVKEVKEVRETKAEKEVKSKPKAKADSGKGNLLALFSKKSQTPAS